MGTNVDELKKIHDLDLDDYVDDATLTQIRADLVSCDDTIRTIAANPAFEGETQLAVNGALAQLQAEVRKWYAAVDTIKSERTTARDSMRTAKPKYDELPAHTSDVGDEMMATDKRRDLYAAEALSPMDTTLTTSAAALRAIDLSRPEFDPNRKVDQTPLDELPASSAAGYGGGSGAGYGSGAAGAGSSGAAGVGSTAGYGAGAYGTGHAVPLATTGVSTGAIGTAAVASTGRFMPNSHTGYAVTQVDRFTSSVNGPASAQSTAYEAGRYTVENGRLVPLASATQHTSGTTAVGGAGNTGLVVGSVGTAAASAAVVAAVRGLGGASTAGSTVAAAGINGSTGVAATNAGQAAARGTSAAGTGAAGRPVAGAPAAGRGAGQSRNRRRPHGTYDIPLLVEEAVEERMGDPGAAGQAGSLETLTTPEWTQESDTW